MHTTGVGIIVGTSKEKEREGKVVKAGKEQKMPGKKEEIKE